MLALYENKKMAAVLERPLLVSTDIRVVLVIFIPSTCFNVGVKRDVSSRPATQGRT